MRRMMTRRPSEPLGLKRENHKIVCIQNYTYPHRNGLSKLYKRIVFIYLHTIYRLSQVKRRECEINYIDRVTSRIID